MDAEVDLGANDGVGGDADLREQTVAPVALHGVGDIVAWHLNLLAYGETRKTGEYIVFIAFDTLDGNTANLAVARRARVADVGIDDLILGSEA